MSRKLRPPVARKRAAAAAWSTRRRRKAAPARPPAPPTLTTNSTGDLDTGAEESGLVDTGFEDDGPPPVCDPQLCDGQCIEGECVYPRIVFVSSVGFSGDMDGLEGAHELCTELGQNAGWGGSFRAWLSDQTSSPALHMVHGDDPFIRPDGELVAWDWDDLTDGELEAPISLTEWGDPGPETFICTGREVWSNTDIHGSVATNQDCNGWTNGNVGITSEVGEWDMQDASWAWTENCGSVSCGAVLPVYCIQQ